VKWRTAARAGQLVTARSRALQPSKDDVAHARHLRWSATLHHRRERVTSSLAAGLPAGCVAGGRGAAPTLLPPRSSLRDTAEQLACTGGQQEPR
jgi:hypothetical protein